MRAGSPESKSHPGLHQKKRGQLVTGDALSKVSVREKKKQTKKTKPKKQQQKKKKKKKKEKRRNKRRKKERRRKNNSCLWRKLLVLAVFSANSKIIVTEWFI
ncbi:hypothetical protein llap_10242 [Limosa lapponica baueri]|uniref:Uncharacterized protein n=1 Tax=Limosa lapponica baueri TaxID=1758121 RepID=A0A2I0U047_LIMLA|nr:hypothetical protein llap_10242 [Limosa lapponica baueri]